MPVQRVVVWNLMGLGLAGMAGAATRLDTDPSEDLNRAMLERIEALEIRVSAHEEPGREVGLQAGDASRRVERVSRSSRRTARRTNDDAVAIYQQVPTAAFDGLTLGWTDGVGAVVLEPLAEVGLEPGDIIVSVDGDSVEDAADALSIATGFTRRGRVRFDVGSGDRQVSHALTRASSD